MRHEQVHDGEDGFFTFPGITRPTDENNLFGEVHNDKCFGVGAILGGNGFTSRRLDDGELGNVVRPLLGR